jgi:hypothetical protein
MIVRVGKLGIFKLKEGSFKALLDGSGGFCATANEALA